MNKKTPAQYRKSHQGKKIAMTAAQQAKEIRRILKDIALPWKS